MSGGFPAVSTKSWPPLNKCHILHYSGLRKPPPTGYCIQCPRYVIRLLVPILFFPFRDPPFHEHVYQHSSLPSFLLLRCRTFFSLPGRASLVDHFSFFFSFLKICLKRSKSDSNRYIFPFLSLNHPMFRINVFLRLGGRHFTLIGIDFSRWSFRFIPQSLLDGTELSFPAKQINKVERSLCIPLSRTPKFHKFTSLDFFFALPCDSPLMDEILFCFFKQLEFCRMVRMTFFTEILVFFYPPIKGSEHDSFLSKTASTVNIYKKDLRPLCSLIVTIPLDVHRPKF